MFAYFFIIFCYLWLFDFMALTHTATYGAHIHTYEKVRALFLLNIMILCFDRACRRLCVARLRVFIILVLSAYINLLDELLVLVV